MSNPATAGKTAESGSGKELQRSRCPVWCIFTSVGDADTAQMLAEALVSAGYVSVISVSSAVTVAVEDAIVVGFARDAEAAHLQELAKSCAEQRLVWVRCVIDGRRGFADAGPCFRGLAWPRFGAFTAVYTPGFEPEGEAALHPATLRFWSQVLARPLLELCARVKYGEVPAEFTRYSIRGHSSQRLRASGLALPQLSHPAALSKLFEDATARDRVRSPAALARAGKPKVHKLTDAYPNSRFRALPQVGPLEPKGVGSLLLAASQPGSRVSADVLSALLLYSNGERARERLTFGPSRYAANAGNLGSAMVSVLDGVLQDRLNLSNYRPERHDLARLEPRGVRSACRTLLQNCLADTEAVLCWTGKLDALLPKYGAFSYRLILLDCGVAFAQASLVARSFGLSLRIEGQVKRNKVSKLLNLRTEERHVMLIASLGWQGVDRRRSESRPNIVPASAYLYETPEEMGRALRRASLSTTDCSALLEQDIHAATPSTVTLAEDERVQTTLEAVLRARRSVRSFSRREPSWALLKKMIEWTDLADSRDWPARSAQFSYHVVSARGSQRHSRFFKRGFGWSIPETGTGDGLNALYVDVCFAQAPTAIWICGDFSTVASPRSYEELVIRAGAACNYIWLLGIEHGFCGAMSAGLVARAAEELFGMNGWYTHPLCALVLGFADDPNPFR